MLVLMLLALDGLAAKLRAKVEALKYSTVGNHPVLSV